MRFNPQITLDQLSTQIAALPARPNLSGLQLPQPNVYWVTVRFFDGVTHNLYMAGDHPRSVIRKVSNHGAAHWGIRPLKGNSLIQLKRLDAIDLVQNPAAFEQARRTAALNNERDIIEGLDKIPGLIALHVALQPCAHAINHIPLQRTSAAELWASVAEELEKIEAPVRVLR